jgi:hypothetical protein
MVQLNAAVRLTADAKAEIEQDVKAGKYKIIHGEGKRWMAVEFANGRFGVIDSEAPGTHNKIRASGLGRETAIHAVDDANAKHKFNPVTTLR